MSEEKVWVVSWSGLTERIRAEKVRFIGDGGYNGGRCLKLMTKGQVKAVYASGVWNSVHLEGAQVVEGEECNEST